MPVSATMLGPRTVRRAGPLGLSLLAVALAGCGWPRDPERTGEHVQGKVLRAGVSENPPWVRYGPGGEVQGVEANLIRAIAADTGSQVQWVRGGESALMKAAKDNRLDLVAGGITQESPWAKELGAPRPYAEVAGEKHLVLTPPGENGWIVRLDRITRRRRSEIDRWVSLESAAR